MFPSPLAKYASLLCLIGLLGIARQATSGTHFTTPVPTLEQALSQATTQGKVLVLVFSAVWCGPCKVLARALRKPAAQSDLATTHLVIYDGDEDATGRALMKRLGLHGFPSIVAMDRTGQPAARLSGFGTWDSLAQWLKTLPDRALPIDEALATWRAHQSDGPYLLALAQRLILLRRYDDARPILSAVRTTGPSKLAAAAGHELLRIDYDQAHGQLLARLVPAYLGQFPDSVESSDLLRLLAVQPQTDRAVLEHLLAQRINRQVAQARPGTQDIAELISLGELALLGHAQGAARRIAQLVTDRAPTQAEGLVYRAEVAFWIERRSDLAISLMQAAAERARDSDEKATYDEHLARYRRVPAELPLSITAGSLPSLRPPTADGAPLRARYLVRLAAAERAVRERCFHTVATPLTLSAMILSPKAGPRQVLFHPATPPALLACAQPLLLALELPPGRVFSVSTAIEAPSDEEALELAVATAEETCAAQAGDRRRYDLIVRAIPGAPPTLYVLDGSEALQHCLEGTFATLSTVHPVLVRHTLRFPKK